MLTIDLDLPITHESIIAATVKALTSLNKPSKPNYTGRPKATGLEVGKRARCLVLDHVASVPGYVSSYYACYRKSGLDDSRARRGRGGRVEQ